MSKHRQLLLTPYLVAIAILLLSAGCICGGQTGGFLCGGDDDSAGIEYPADAGEDAAIEPTESAFDLDVPCPLGFSAAEVLQQLSERSRATLTWGRWSGQTGQTGVFVEIEYTGEAITFFDYADPRCDLLYGTCDALRIPVRITVRTDDGLFNEQWDGEVLVYQNGTIEVRSTTPIDLRNLNGSYPAASFIKDDPLFSGIAVENVESMEADVLIHYDESERYGTIRASACRVLESDKQGVVCKNATDIATWQL